MKSKQFNTVEGGENMLKESTIVSDNISLELFVFQESEVVCLPLQSMAKAEESPFLGRLGLSESARDYNIEVRDGDLFTSVYVFGGMNPHNIAAYVDSCRVGSTRMVYEGRQYPNPKESPHLIARAHCV
jgi:hypothetical protein